MAPPLSRGHGHLHLQRIADASGHEHRDGCPNATTTTVPGSVGGIAEDPGPLAPRAGRSTTSSRSNTAQLAAIGSAAIVAVLSAGWLVMRRSSRRI